MPSGDYPLMKRGSTTPLGGPRQHDFLDRLGRASFKEAFPTLLVRFWRWTIAILELINKERKYVKVSGLPFSVRAGNVAAGFSFRVVYHLPAQISWCSDELFLGCPAACRNFGHKSDPSSIYLTIN